MTGKAKTSCIGCGQDASAPFQVHALPDGGPCAVCQRRVLEGPGQALPQPPPAFTYLPGGNWTGGPRRLIPGLSVVAARYEEPPEPA